MSDLIFKTDGKETHRISFPTLGTKCPEIKLEIKMTETDISKVLIEGEYATIMGVKYKRVEEPKTPVEEAYKEWWGEYPTNTWQVDVNRWDAFQAGYNAAYEEKVSETAQERGERVHNEMEETIRIHDGYGVVDYQPTPQTPEQVADGLKEAFREAVKQGVVSSTKSKTLTDLIYRWWEDVFTTHSDWDMETSIANLVDRIELFLPKEQSAAGSQNAYVECTVEGFNDCLNKIKGKLR